MKNKQSVNKVLSNNWFILKICFMSAPGYMIASIVDNLRNNIGIFLGRTIVIAYILEAIEFHHSFKKVAIVLVILFLYSSFGMIYSGFYYHSVAEKGFPRIKEKLEMMLYSKAKDMDLEYCDNPEYYNDFVLSISQAEKQIRRTLDLMQMVLTCICVFATNGAYFFVKDKVSIIFMFAAFWLSMLMNKIYSKVNFEIKMQKNPNERKRDYINRVFYLNEYAKELRLNKKISEKMFDQFRNTNETIYNVDKENSGKKFLLGFAKDYLCNDFVSDILYILYLSYKAVVRNLLSYSEVVVLYNSSGRLKRAMRTLSQIYPYASETSLYIDKIKEFLKIESSIKTNKNLDITFEAKKVELDDVSFSYGKLKDENYIPGREIDAIKGKKAINHINMTISPGEKIALVGYNGAGKTTLIKLIMRLYDTDSGRIMIDGNNIKDYNVEKYRKHIGVVFQDYALFAATVKENILLDKPAEGSNLDNNIYSAIRQSGFTNRFVDLSNGLDTELTTEFYHDGISLSGGESQKLAIARAFYKNAGLIILDEPSSALDPIAEYHLNQAILEASKNKSVIFISHRLSTTKFADKIYMLENGSIVEYGTHEELIKQDGKYSRMWKAQAGRYCESLGKSEFV